MIVTFAGLAFAAWAQAGTIAYNDAHFGIDLPSGYLGPVEHVSGPSISRGFRKPLPGTALSTVILVSVQGMGPSFARRVPLERAQLTRETLEPIMAGIESNRSGSAKPRRAT